MSSLRNVRQVPSPELVELFQHADEGFILDPSQPEHYAEFQASGPKNFNSLGNWRRVPGPIHLYAIVVITSTPSIDKNSEWDFTSNRYGGNDVDFGTGTARKVLRDIDSFLTEANQIPSDMMLQPDYIGFELMKIGGNGLIPESDPDLIRGIMSSLSATWTALDLEKFITSLRHYPALNRVDTEYTTTTATATTYNVARVQHAAPGRLFARPTILPPGERISLVAKSPPYDLGSNEGLAAAHASTECVIKAQFWGPIYRAAK